MKSTIAAAILASVTLAVTLGSIWSAEEARAYCPIDAPCPLSQTAGPAPSSTLATTGDWMEQVEQGFLHLAGMPPQH